MRFGRMGRAANRSSSGEEAFARCVRRLVLARIGTWDRWKDVNDGRAGPVASSSAHPRPLWRWQRIAECGLLNGGPATNGTVISVDGL